MNGKSLFALLVTIALVASSAQALVIKQTHNKKEMHLVKEFVKELGHNMFDRFHLQSSDDAAVQSGTDFMMDFLVFALSDSEIAASLGNGQPLSASSAAKVKDFFRSNKGFSDMMLAVFKGDDAPACLKNLSDAQQKKLVNIFIDQTDFTKMLGGSDDAADDANDQKIVDAVSNDSTLGPDVAQCYADNSASFFSS